MIACHNSNNDNNKRRKLHRILRALVLVWHVFDAPIDIKKLVCFEFRMSILRYFMCHPLVCVCVFMPAQHCFKCVYVYIGNMTGDW